MATDSPRNQLRRANLEMLLADPAIGKAAGLARLLGKPGHRSLLSAIRNSHRGMGDELAADIEHVTGKPRGWMDRQHTFAGENPPAWQVAQDVSYRAASDDLPLLAWETIVHDQTPAVFRAVLPDDALAPDYPAGTEIVWTTRRRALPGRLVLVQDRHGQLHARQCHQGRAPGQWIAAPISPAFVTFDSHEDGLRLVAVYKGRLEPDDL